jgi:hypothetical protein
MRIVIAAFVALLILFSWLRLILALEIASTGREIQQRTGDLERIQRLNDHKRAVIARAKSPQTLHDAAYAQGFRPYQPIYVSMPRPLVTSGDETTWGTGLTALPSEQRASALADQSLLDLASGELDNLFETEVAP